MVDSDSAMPGAAGLQFEYLVTESNCIQLYQCTGSCNIRACLCVCQALHVKSVDTATQSVQTTAIATRSISVQITPASRSKGINHFEFKASN